MTILEFCTAEQIPLSTARLYLKRHGIKFDRHREAAAQEQDIIRGAKPAESPRKKPAQVRAKTIASDAQELRADVEMYAHDFTRNIAQGLAQVTREVDAQDAPRKDQLERATILVAPILITALSVTLTITGLYVFTGWGGAILGSMFALYLFKSVVLSRNRLKGWTSEQALATVLRLEIGAAVLHCFTFWRLLPELPAGNPLWEGVEFDGYTAFKAATCLVLAGFVAFLSYKAVQSVRSYYAEVEEPEKQEEK
jgi:hypothetical protein